MVTSQGFVQELKNQNYILKRQNHVKVLLKDFSLNGNTTVQDFVHRLKRQNYIQSILLLCKVLLKRFQLNGHTIGFVHRVKSQHYIVNEQYHVNVRQDKIALLSLCCRLFQLAMPFQLALKMVRFQTLISRLRLRIIVTTPLGSAD